MKDCRNLGIYFLLYNSNTVNAIFELCQIGESCEKIMSIWIYLFFYNGQIFYVTTGKEYLKYMKTFF